MKTPGGWAYFSAASLSVLGPFPGVEGWFCGSSPVARPGKPKASAPLAPAWRKSCLRVIRVRVNANVFSKSKKSELMGQHGQLF
jgi:hypothetical protein